MSLEGYFAPGYTLITTLDANMLTGGDTADLYIKLRNPREAVSYTHLRVAIGRALITNPALILADEPTGNLDSKNSAEIIELLKMYNQRYKQTLIIVTHDERIALQASRIISLEDGKIISDEVIRP